MENRIATGENVLETVVSNDLCVGRSNLLGTGVFMRKQLRWWRQWNISLYGKSQIKPN